MIKRNKDIENKLRTEGFIKLKIKNSDSPKYRYMAPGNGSNKSIVCIENGSVYGVYIGSGWSDKYEIVDWNSPDCDCDECKLNDAGEEMAIISSGFASAIRNMENLDVKQPINIYGLNVTKEKNGWNKTSFYYKVDNV